MPDCHFSKGTPESLLRPRVGLLFCSPSPETARGMGRVSEMREESRANHASRCLPSRSCLPFKLDHANGTRSPAGTTRARQLFSTCNSLAAAYVDSQVASAASTSRSIGTRPIVCMGDERIAANRRRPGAISQRRVSLPRRTFPARKTKHPSRAADDPRHLSCGRVTCCVSGTRRFTRHPSRGPGSPIEWRGSRESRRFSPIGRTTEALAQRGPMSRGKTPRSSSEHTD